uniref:Uncharacterized protein n=1 Tax=Corethron hystrix TaxID=216773 RepID=A0A7S1B326_9STRA|mmetsp:Transcript_10779/g.23679  ORF Transcript_10779/g.23679 Transcript_10779/m.23679 type:complete len:242 (+) Transcript_10779:125-850(+)
MRLNSSIPPDRSHGPYIYTRIAESSRLNVDDSGTYTTPPASPPPTSEEFYGESRNEIESISNVSRRVSSPVKNCRQRSRTPLQYRRSAFRAQLAFRSLTVDTRLAEERWEEIQRHRREPDWGGRSYRHGEGGDTREMGFGFRPFSRLLMRRCAAIFRLQTGTLEETRSLEEVVGGRTIVVRYAILTLVCVSFILAYGIFFYDDVLEGSFSATSSRIISWKIDFSGVSGVRRLRGTMRESGW